MSSFTFPSIYKFPPFFTKQIHLDTANSQLTIWCKLILQYCQFYNIWILNNSGEPVIQQDEFQLEEDSPEHVIPKDSIFTNTEINRSLRPEFVREIINQLCKSGNAEIINNQQFYVYYKTLDELSNALLQWVENTGQQGNILTFYELSHGELTRNELFHNIDQQVLLKIINKLVSAKRAVILKGDNGKIMGVKIQ